MVKTKQFLLIVIFTLGSSTSFAETITIPIANQGNYLGNVDKPVTGQKKRSVQAKYGQPMASSGPSGEPPITRWDYENFSVYFESETVIHSVLKHRKQNELPAK